MFGVLSVVLLMLLLPPPAVAGAAERKGNLAWCYRTLADVVCYTAPDPGRENRFVGAYPFRPDAARRKILEAGARRAAAAVPKRWPPAQPAPPAEPPAPAAPSAAAPTASAAPFAKAPPVPVMRPARRVAEATAVKTPAAPRSRPSEGGCRNPVQRGPRPLTGAVAPACDTETD